MRSEIENFRKASSKKIQERLEQSVKSSDNIRDQTLIDRADELLQKKRGSAVFAEKKQKSEKFKNQTHLKNRQSIKLRETKLNSNWSSIRKEKEEEESTIEKLRKSAAQNIRERKQQSQKTKKEENKETKNIQVPREIKRALISFNLEERASFEDLKKRKKELLMKWHPDLQKQSGSSEEYILRKTQEILETFEVLEKYFKNQ